MNRSGLCLSHGSILIVFRKGTLNSRREESRLKRSRQRSLSRRRSSPSEENGLETSLASSFLGAFSTRGYVVQFMIHFTPDVGMDQGRDLQAISSSHFENNPGSGGSGFGQDIFDSSKATRTFKSAVGYT
jgi:hypothetical protein